MRDAPQTPTMEGVLRDLSNRVRSLERRLGSTVAETEPLPFEAVGDLIVGFGYGERARLPVGTNERLLEADSGELLGVRWGRKITASATPPADPAEGDIWIEVGSSPGVGEYVLMETGDSLLLESGGSIGPG